MVWWRDDPADRAAVLHDALYAEYVAHGFQFTRALGDTPWHAREFVVKDRDGRLLAFGAEPRSDDE
jgi:uncharacterized glyoxalase superfamily protein PhnB